MFEHLVGRKPRYIDGEKYRKFAVIAPFVPETEEFVFEVRSDYLKHQPGEICFPGGHVEPGENALQAAVRETREELLVAEESIEVIAPLDRLTTPYYTLVFPFLANLHGYKGTFSTDEVKETFTVPFAFFLENEPMIYYNEVSVRPLDDSFVRDLLQRESYPWLSAEQSILFYQYRGKVIWGMTAKFVKNIVDLYRSGNR